MNIHINISASHARNVRQLTNIVNTYPKLKALHLPLHEVLRNQKLRKEMLAVPEAALFGKGKLTFHCKHTSYKTALQHNRRIQRTVNIGGSIFLKSTFQEAAVWSLLFLSLKSIKKNNCRLNSGI